ncbi:MAG: 5'/3'-nucleotidase SurE [Elusimicrobiaceae bacterium]|nr:5'/3'-nucleotidase SurE [Elusimicrobiaceae bacterium]
MRILITNDDGAYSDGIRILRKHLSRHAGALIVAPATQQSGGGHSITLFHPLRVKTLHENGETIGYMVSGSPADCVKIGICEFMKDGAPDVVVSGINPGGNLGTNLFYSGTVSGAMEALLMGYPAIAVSFDREEDPDYEYGAQLTERLLLELEKLGFPKCLLNVNIPSVPIERIKGIKVTRQGFMRYTENFNKRVDPRGSTYYWLEGERVHIEDELDGDSAAVSQGYISVTPLFYDLTDNKHIKTAQTVVENLQKTPIR